MLHLLRNPHGWSEETIRDARIKAAAELERLWSVTERMQLAAKELNEIIEGGE